MDGTGVPPEIWAAVLGITFALAANFTLGAYQVGRLRERIKNLEDAAARHADHGERIANLEGRGE